MVAEAEVHNVHSQYQVFKHVSQAVLSFSFCFTHQAVLFLFHSFLPYWIVTMERDRKESG